MRSTLGLTLLLAAACSGWHGHAYDESSQGDAGTPGSSTTKPTTPPPDKGHGHDDGADAGEDAGTDPNAPLAPRLGDVKVQSVACDIHNKSCGKGEECCAADDDLSETQCSKGCGPTEPSFACDGSEDCEKGAVCCHQLIDGVRVGKCISPKAPPKKSGSDKDTTKDDAAAPALCANAETEDRVACHEDKDCPLLGKQKQVCRIGKEEGSFFGYCRLGVDDETTLGHDEPGLVSCGSDENKTICGYQGNPCCVGHAGMEHGACSSDGKCGFSEIKVDCDGPEDCAGGKSCCYVPEGKAKDGAVTAARVECRASCDDLGSRERCHVATDCSKPNQVCKGDDNQESPWGTCADQ